MTRLSIAQPERTPIFRPTIKRPGDRIVTSSGVDTEPDRDLPDSRKWRWA